MKALLQLTQLYLYSFILIVCTHVHSSAIEGPPPVLNPETYKSSSGEYSLFVDPSTLHGWYHGEYVFSKNGKELWRGKKPFTLWDVKISDNGIVVGYSYSHGWRGVAETYDKGPGDFRIIFLDSTGRVIKQEITDREYTNSFHSPPYPLCGGIILQEDFDRVMMSLY